LTSVEAGTKNDAAPFSIALIGFGEAGMAFAEGWAGIGNLSLTAFDLKIDSPENGVASDKLSDFQALNVQDGKTAVDAVQGAAAIFSVVTADQALNAAQSVTNGISDGALFFDCNSCAPGTKRKSAAVIEAAGGRYVDVAVMSPVHPKLHKTPLLISGDHVEEAMTVFDCLQMNATIMAGTVGTASSVKMIRSIMMKGFEALFSECVLAGRRAGVDEEVLASLEVTYPGFNFEGRAAYMFERMTQHGLRRAAEMREVALTIEELGLPNGVTTAAVDWQQMLGEIDYIAKGEDYRPHADILLKNLDLVKRN
jgi:3-hydroxyisobutyrate dehydrogenase-like beta-hydroxyacid dehydrogenase